MPAQIDKLEKASKVWADDKIVHSGGATDTPLELMEAVSWVDDVAVWLTPTLGTTGIKEKLQKVVEWFHDYILRQWSPLPIDDLLQPSDQSADGVLLKPTAQLPLENLLVAMGMIADVVSKLTQDPAEPDPDELGTALDMVHNVIAVFAPDEQKWDLISEMDMDYMHNLIGSLAVRVIEGINDKLQQVLST